jgi:hypothetical protein
MKVRRLLFLILLPLGQTYAQTPSDQLVRKESQSEK